MTSNSSDQSVSMSNSDDAQNEADTSFLDDDFLSFSAQDNGGSTSNSSRKRSRSNSPVPSYNGRNKISVPWLVQNGSQSHQHQSHQGRGYNNYHEPSQLIKLHNEIVSFVKLMEPTNEELKVRDQMVERVTDLAKRTFGKRVSF
jgi:DNA polymerase sigma